MNIWGCVWIWFDGRQKDSRSDGDLLCSRLKGTFTSQFLEKFGGEIEFLEIEFLEEFGAKIEFLEIFGAEIDSLQPASSKIFRIRKQRIFSTKANVSMIDGRNESSTWY